MFFNELYYTLIWLFSICFFIRVIQKPELIYLYPYIMSFGFVVFILPQVFTVYEKKLFETVMTNRLFFMTLLCWVMSFIGWYAFKPNSLVFKNTFLKDLNEGKLGITSALFVCLGILFNFLAYRILSTVQFANQQATGIVTIYLFFQQLLFLGAGLSLALWLNSKKKLYLTFAVLGILYGFYIGLFQGRRTQTLYTLLVLGVPLFIKYRIRPSRIILVTFLLIAFLVIPSIGQYRTILRKSDSSSQFFHRLTTEIDFKKNLQALYMNPNSLELVNAGYMIDHTYQNSNYRLGIDYWNELVFRFVPAQIVGNYFKESLRINESILSNKSHSSYSYNPNYLLGTTNTGIGDSFYQFDYLGSLFFLVIGSIMRRIWVTANETGSPIVQVFYSVLLIESLVSLTHGTTYFLPGYFSAFIFLSIANWVSKS